MVAFPALAGVAIVATLAMTLWTGVAWNTRAIMLALWSTVIVMFLGIGWERLGFGVPSAGSTRYVHVAAIVLAPAFALTVDQLARLSERARWAGRLVLLLAVGVNAGALRAEGAHWAIASRDEQDLFVLVAGSPEVASAKPDAGAVDAQSRCHRDAAADARRGRGDHPAATRHRRGEGARARRVGLPPP